MTLRMIYCWDRYIACIFVFQIIECWKIVVEWRYIAKCITFQSKYSSNRNEKKEYGLQHIKWNYISIYISESNLQGDEASWYFMGQKEKEWNWHIILSWIIDTCICIAYFFIAINTFKVEPVSRNDVRHTRK